MTPEQKDHFDKLFADLFPIQPDGKRPDPKLYPSQERLLRVNTARDAINVGYEVPTDLLSYVLDLITVDRSERVSSASKERKAAKAFEGIPTADEL